MRVTARLLRAEPRLSGIKTLLPCAGMDAQMNLPAKMIDHRTCTSRINHSYGPFFLEYSLLAEYNLLQMQRMPGVYVIPSAKSPLRELLPHDQDNLCTNAPIFVSD